MKKSKKKLHAIKLENTTKLKKMNEIENIDAFEILDIEEKLDFTTKNANCPCVEVRYHF